MAWDEGFDWPGCHRNRLHSFPDVQIAALFNQVIYAF